MKPFIKITTAITVVIEYKEGQIEPRFHAGMEVLGGTIIAVQFNDALEEIERLNAFEEYNKHHHF